MIDSNVINLVDKHNNEEPASPWRLTGMALKRVKMRYDDTGEVVDGFQVYLEFLDREPQTILTQGPQKGYKGVQFAIPKGTRMDDVNKLFWDLPEMIEQALNPQEAS